MIKIARPLAVVIATLALCGCPESDTQRKADQAKANGTAPATTASAGTVSRASTGDFADVSGTYDAYPDGAAGAYIGTQAQTVLTVATDGTMVFGSQTYLLHRTPGGGYETDGYDTGPSGGAEWLILTAAPAPGSSTPGGPKLMPFSYLARQNRALDRSSYKLVRRANG